MTWRNQFALTKFDQESSNSLDLPHRWFHSDCKIPGGKTFPQFMCALINFMAPPAQTWPGIFSWCHNPTHKSELLKASCSFSWASPLLQLHLCIQRAPETDYFQLWLTLLAWWIPNGVPIIDQNINNFFSLIENVILIKMEHFRCLSHGDIQPCAWCQGAPPPPFHTSWGCFLYILEENTEHPLPGVWSMGRISRPEPK